MNKIKHLWAFEKVVCSQNIYFQATKVQCAQVLVQYTVAKKLLYYKVYTPAL